MPKAKKDYGKATLAGAKKEMAKPRVAKSAGKNYPNLGLSVPTNHKPCFELHNFVISHTKR
jgi:hypothetical protein